MNKVLLESGSSQSKLTSDEANLFWLVLVLTAECLSRLRSSSLRLPGRSEFLRRNDILVNDLSTGTGLVEDKAIVVLVTFNAAVLANESK